ncbi:MAG: hypothetical protein RLY43_805 [Bacteroidota bacterium]|jgi:hypothetical protein
MELKPDNFPNPKIKTEEVPNKEGVDFVFNQNPELSEIGTKEQYSEYLDTIFPGSKVKDILYHGTGLPNYESIKSGGFDPNLMGESKVIFFTGSIGNGFTEMGGVVAAVVNIESLFNNRFTSLYKDKISSNSESFYLPTQQDIESDVYHMVSIRNPGNIFIDKDKNVSEVSVLNNNQIHILGSEPDIEKFKKFVKNNYDSQA